MILNGKTYSQMVSNSALDHDRPDDRDADTVFRLLTYKMTNDVAEPAQDFKLDKDKEPDSFFPLCWLIGTNYAWGLDISTEPKSLWLIYKYVECYDEYEDVRDLSKVYHNPQDRPLGHDTIAIRSKGISGPAYILGHDESA
ncbi:MAG: hypothetical protein Q9179_006285 [Wetmoreana sp. 5 TL-2023]